MDRKALWKALRGVGVPQVIMKLIKDLHAGTTSRVRVGGVISDCFLTSSGVRQGCVLAPALFCRAIDLIWERIACSAGIHVGDHLFTDLDYADDVALLVGQTSELQPALEQFELEAEKLGLHLSWQKTKVQNLGAGDQEPDVTACGNTVEGVTRVPVPGLHAVVVWKESHRHAQAYRNGVLCHELHAPGLASEQAEPRH